MEVARTARRFPLVLDLLASGAVNLTTVRLLGPHLTADNHSRVLESARGKRKADVEEIVARLAPRPDVPPSVRKLPVRTVVAAPGVDSRSPGVASAAPPDDARPVGAESSPLPTGCPRGLAEQRRAAAVPRPQAPHEAAAALTPLSPDRYRYQLTIGGATLEKLRLAKDMLRHALSSGDDEALLDRALTLLLHDLARKRFGSEESARTSRKPAKHSRDLGRCAFVAEDGGRCGERAFVEFHHLRPYAAGGEATVGNVELRCRAHNGYEARLFFPRPEDRLFVLERIASRAAVLSGGVTRSTATSPTALPSALGRPGGVPTAGPPRAPRQAMLL